MIWSAIKRQLRSVVEWETSDHSTLFELWSENGDEIKDASKLIVKPGQGCVFVYQGELVGTLETPGTVDLKTDNIPFVTTLSRYMQAFESEHKTGLYYYWLTEFLNQKWGTRSPVKYDDPVYGFPVGLRAFGNFSFRLTDAERFFVNLLGSRRRFPVDLLRTTLADRMQPHLAEVMAESAFSYSEVDRQRDEIAEALVTRVAPEFERLGVALTDFRIEATNFDAETNARIGRVADVSAEAVAAQRAGLDYAGLQQVEALREAARNEGGAAGAGIGIGAGIGLGQAFGNLAPGTMQPAAPTPAKVSIEERLEKLKSLLDKGLISDADYDARKQQILAEL